MGTLIVVALALGGGAAIGFGYGRVLGDERAYRQGWHDCLDRLCHPAERRLRPLPPRPLPDARRRIERGLSTFDAALLGLTAAALIVGASILFGG